MKGGSTSSTTLKNLENKVTNNTTEITKLANQQSTNTTNISTNTNDIADNLLHITTDKNAISANTSNVSRNTTSISANTTNISLNTSKLTTANAEITSLKNKVTALKVTHTVTKNIHTGSQTRKAGKSTAVDNTNKCAELTVPSDGYYLITYHVIIQPTDIYYDSATVKDSWYYTKDSVNLELHTALYHHIKATSSTSIIPGTSVSTDGGHYNKNNSHHILRQEGYVLAQGDTLKIESLCDDFNDNFSYLYYNAREAQISILKLTN